jgi:hypothetical protein
MADEDEHIVTLDEVKHNVLRLLTDLYKKDNSDTKRTAMSLLTTLYKVETKEEVAEMQVKMHSLLAMMKEDNEIVEEIYHGDCDEWSTAGHSCASDVEDEFKDKIKRFSEDPDLDEISHQSKLPEVAMNKKEEATRWQQNVKSSKERLLKGWRESRTKVEDKISVLDNQTKERREILLKGWRDSTSKVNRTLRKRRVSGDNPSNMSIRTYNADLSADLSESDSETSPSSDHLEIPKNEKEERLNVFRNFIKKESRDENSQEEDIRKPIWGRWFSADEEVCAQ